MIIKDYKKKELQRKNEEKIETRMEQVPSLKEIYGVGEIKRFTINQSLIESIDDKGMFMRVPRTRGEMYMYLPEDKCKKIGEETWQFDFDENKMFDIYDKNGIKSKTLSGNEILKYWDEKERLSSHDEMKMEQVPSLESMNDLNSKYLAFTVNKKLIEEFDRGKIFCRIPNTRATKYMYLEQDQWQQLNQFTVRYLFDVNKKVNIYTINKELIETVNGSELLNYWDRKNISELTEKEKSKIGKKGERRRTNRKYMKQEINSTKTQVDEDLYRKKKTIGYYKKRARRWQKGRNIGVSDSELYREMMEWERNNGIGQNL